VDKTISFHDCTINVGVTQLLNIVSISCLIKLLSLVLGDFRFILGGLTNQRVLSRLIIIETIQTHSA